MTTPADTPSPRPLSEEERALWEKATAAHEALSVITKPVTLNASAWDISTAEGSAARAWVNLTTACQPAVILSLLTALASEREAGERLRAEVICVNCNHTHAKHLEGGEDGPCYGDDATCMCAGFEREEPAHV